MDRKSIITVSVQAALLAFVGTVCAEGIVEFKPYVGAGVTYDSNVYRLSDPQQAPSLIGTSQTSDIIYHTEIGANLNLRLSRQLVTISGELDDNQYKSFSQLSNVGKSAGLTWSWQLGNHLSGKIGVSESESATGFNDIRQLNKNTKTTDHEFASAYWQVHPSWTVYLSQDEYQTRNDNMNNVSLDRDTQTTETGVIYNTSAATQLGLAYRNTDISYPGRFGLSSLLFGNESQESAIILSATWIPTNKIRVNGSISEVNVDYKDKPQRSISGQNERLSLDYTLSGKTSLNVTAYKEFSTIDDLISTYVEVSGVTVSPSWIITDKLRFTGNLGMEKRDYLGTTGLFSTGPGDRFDQSTTFGLGLSYQPTNKSNLQFGYSGEHRSSTITGQGYDFNTLGMTFRYRF